MRDAFQERGPELHRAAGRQFLNLFIEWVKDPIQRTAQYDTERFDRLREIADEALQAIAARYQGRLLLHAVRGLPLPAVAYLLGSTPQRTPGQDFGDILSTATAAVVRGGRRTKPRQLPGGKTVAEVTLEELERLPRTLPEDAARLLAAAGLRSNAVRGHRMAGKGMRLRPLPSPDALARGVAAPEWHLTPNPPVTEAIDSYMRRRSDEPSVSGTHHDRTDGSLAGAWMTLSVPRAPVTVRFPRLQADVVTHCFIWRPEPSTSWFGRLSAFAPQVLAGFGLEVEALRAICAWLTTAVARQAGWDTVRPEPVDSWTLTFDLQPDDPRAESAPQILYDLHGKGLLRSPRREWVRMVAKACETAGRANPQQQAETFVEVFTAKPTDQLGPDWPDLRPQLFFEVDEGHLSLDLIHAADFLDLCLRVVTAGDGAVGNQRAALFEEQARQRIRVGLRLASKREPWPANAHVPQHHELGDVDYCFTVGRMLVVLDMKSWQRTAAYHRGGYLAVDNRQKELTEHLERLERRAEALLQALKQRGLALDVASSFLCVANVEYVSPFYRRLWYRRVPRVLTPDEIVKLAANRSRMDHLRHDLLRSV